MLRICYILIGIVFLLAGWGHTAKAQDPFQRIGGRLGQMGQAAQGSQGGDSLQHRTGLEDSITIRFRYLDTSRLQEFDSSLFDFGERISVPWHHVHLGNYGNASRSLLFSPVMKAGWDHGFHNYDIYNFTVEETPLFNTTRPYSELNYLLGSQAEQMIRLHMTQNITPNWNAAIEYRLINSPGFFQNQNTNHNNYRFSSWYRSRNKRYQNFIVVVGNKLQSGENGGILDQEMLNDTEAFRESFSIPTLLGPDQSNSARNFFSSSIATGTYYTNATYLFRQQYDLGQKDSIVTDSVVIPLFYPRLRLEHTISYNTYKYRFRDNYADSIVYDSLYNLTLVDAADSIFRQDYWTELVNDFSLYQFPDAKNAQQFFKAGASLALLKGHFDNGTVVQDYHNFFLHGEYRNKTRNQKWDIEASGQFYVNGFNAGDYNAYASLKRLLSKKIGYLQAGFQNTNRTPSFVFNSLSSFYLAAPEDFKKENITSIFGSIENPARRLKVSANYNLVTNYTYYTGYYQPSQSPVLFNVLQVNAEKQFNFTRNFHWRTWIVLQQRIGDGPVNLPLLSTRNQVGYDGKLGFKNLQTSFGLEFRYFTPYKAPLYSPLIGQYVFQDTTTISMRRPDISGYLHFRIKSFTAYVRAENLNAFDFATGKFTRNNVPTFNYPYPGLQIRVGIFWSFVN